MRFISNKSLETMVSPVKFVMRYLHRAIVNIAPERDRTFDKVYSEFTIEYLDEPAWICEVDPDAKQIRLSRRVAEVAWCAAYAYLAFYDKIQQLDHSVPNKLDLHNDTTTAPAMKLLSWAFGNWLNNEDDAWPDNLPCPVEKPVDKSPEHVADEVCLATIAFMLHHELAHIRLGHGSKTSDRTGAERDADYEAAGWVMVPGIDPNDYRFIKRMIGVAVAFDLMNAKAIYTGDFGGRNHPRSFDRLQNTLSLYVKDPNHVTWYLVAMVMKLHLDNAGIAVPAGPFDSAHACVGAYIEVLSRRSA